MSKEPVNSVTTAKGLPGREGEGMVGELKRGESLM